MKTFLKFLAVSAVAFLLVLGAGAAFAGGPGATAQTWNNTITYNGRVNVQGGIFVDGGMTIGGTVTQKPVVGHTLSDAGQPELAIETRVITMSSNTATYTFNQAFSYPPICTCGDTTITTPVACSANTPTVSQVAIFSIGASAVVNVICVGAR